MNKCDLCGKELVEDAIFCSNCGALKCKNCGRFNPRESASCENCGCVLKKEINISEHIDNAKKTITETGEAINGFAQEAYTSIKEQQEKRQISYGSDNFVMLTDGEVIIRRYLITKLISPKIKGWLTVTNKRMIFHGKGYGSKIVTEVPIDSVGSIMTFYGHNIKLLLLIVGIVFCVLSFNVYTIFDALPSEIAFYVYVMGYDAAIPGLIALLLIVGCGLIFLSIKKTFNFAVCSSKAMGTPIQVGRGANSILGNSAIMSLVGYPSDDTEKMMYEIGALVLDIQQKGDLAIDKWK